MLRRRLVITGKVQGVWYRGWFTDCATAAGLVGWIRNRSDGSVEAVVEGSPEAVKSIVIAAHQGPPAARVERVAVSDDTPSEPLTGFAQRPIG